jgi:ankyrin repeat protein
MVQNELQSRSPSRNSRFVDEAMRHLPGLSTDMWAIFKAANDGDAEKVNQLLTDNPALCKAEYASWQPLHFAARAGHGEVVAILLDMGADPLARIWWHGYYNALEAAHDREHEEVVGLLETAIKEQHRGEPERGSLISEAIESGDAARIARLLEADPSLVNVADIRVRRLGENSVSRQPLHIAVDMNRFDLVDLLIERGADLEGTRGDGFKPIHIALWKDEGWEFRENTQMAAHLLAKGVEYSICVAGSLGDLDTVQRLVQQEPSHVNFLDTNKRRPLSCAAERGHAEIVRFLLEHGADPNLPERDASRGYALFAVTRQHENVELARMLLEAGADPYAVWNASADVRFALTRTRNEELRRLLYEHGAVAGLGAWLHEGRLDLCAEILAANPSLAQEHLYDAIQQEHLALVKLMIRHGARFELRRPFVWQTALAQSLARRRTELAAFLIDNGEDINWGNWFEQAPIHYCIMADCPDMVEWSLEHGADIEARDWELESRPLAWAAHVGARECVEVLLGRGARVHHPQDQPWNTPVARAKKRGHTELAELLRQRGTSE